MEQAPQQTKVSRTAYISFNAAIEKKEAQTLVAVMFQQIQEGFDEIYILFSTLGGSVADGMTLYNTIRAMPGTVTMHNVGNVDSIGNAVFLAGKHRFACKHSTFMFHGVSWEINQRVEEKGLREYLDSVVADQRRIGGIITDHTSLPAVEVEGLFAEAKTKDANFAVTCGLAHEIRDVQIPHGAVVIPLVF